MNIKLTEYITRQSHTYISQGQKKGLMHIHEPISQTIRRVR